MLTNKKADTTALEFFVRFVFAIILVLTAISMVKSFFNLTSQAENSFYDLSKTISEIKPDELNSFPLVMDRGSVIIGFAKQADFVATKLSVVNTLSYIKRISSCEQGKACLCLCRSNYEQGQSQKLSETDFANEGNLNQYNIDPSSKSDFSVSEFVCQGELLCKSIDSIDFISAADPEKIYRDFSGFLVQSGNFQARTNSVFIQRYKNTVAVCFKSPCITEDMKKEIDKKQI